MEQPSRIFIELPGTYFDEGGVLDEHELRRSKETRWLRTALRNASLVADEVILEKPGYKTSAGADVFYDMVKGAPWIKTVRIGQTSPSDIFPNWQTSVRGEALWVARSLADAASQGATLYVDDDPGTFVGLRKLFGTPRATGALTAGCAIPNLSTASWTQVDEARDELRSVRRELKMIEAEGASRAASSDEVVFEVQQEYQRRILEETLNSRSFKTFAKQTLVSTAVAFIPIPVVGDLVRSGVDHLHGDKKLESCVARAYGRVAATK